MTIKQLSDLTDSGTDIILNYAGSKEKLNRFQDSFQMIAYGDFIIGDLAVINGNLEAAVKVIPARKR